ncbi:MAG: hypothetical protein EOO38_07700 [Cytophagaceae bacterium]|nr:MAG: hypothetical protein EOO38_07700 [Cytophagaceae bacterium]
MIGQASAAGDGRDFAGHALPATGEGSGEVDSERVGYQDDNPHDEAGDDHLHKSQSSVSAMIAE